MPPRRPGQHARETAQRLRTGALLAIGAIVTIVFAVGSAAGVGSAAFFVAAVCAVAALRALERIGRPAIGRWDRGARGEESVGRILDGLVAKGWLAIHDVSLGRGNVDHVLVGPGGLVTIETKSHTGRIAVDRIDERMLRQAYAEAKLIERVTDRPVTPLLVFSRAYLDRPVTRVRGVTVLPARMLAGHLARRPPVLTPGEVADIHRRLSASLASGAVSDAA
jgi:hypothetical protein